MSYKGYCQYICKKGHRFDGIDIWRARDGGVDVRCNICKATWVVANEVDKTNGEEFGYICEQDWHSFLDTPEKVVICNYGHMHVLEHATYRIPSESEIYNIRTCIIRWNDKIPVRAYLSTNKIVTEYFPKNYIYEEKIKNKRFYLHIIFAIFLILLHIALIFYVR